MGWCHEFGPHINDTCGHPMTAGNGSCTCADCGVVCHGRFDGCAAVWAAGPREVHLVREPVLPSAAPAAPVYPDDDPNFAKTVEPLIVSATTTNPPSHAAGAGEDQFADGRTEVLAWLSDAFDGVKSELGSLARLVEERGGDVVSAEALASDLERRLVGDMQRFASEGRVSASAGEVDEFVGAIEIRLREFLPEYFRQAASGIAEVAAQVTQRLEECAVDLRHAVGEVNDLTNDAREELARLAAYRRALAATTPQLTTAVDTAAVSAAARRAEGNGHRQGKRRH